MQQAGLFGAASTNTGNTEPSKTTAVEFVGNFANWQRCARTLLQQQREPQSVWWQEVTEQREKLTAPQNATPVRVPRRFITLARQASYHASPDRWALLYSLLWRLTHDEPELLALAGDLEVARLHKYVDAIQRDIHKMKAFVRFREVQTTGEDVARYVAWFEPEHHIVEPAAKFFRDRFSNMRWSILTPSQCAHWEGNPKNGADNSGELWFSEGVDKGDAPSGDEFEEAWRTYYASIFNPARIKLEAMRSEMPQKYWKNLPEAHLIGQLIQDAPARVSAMQAFSKPNETLNCGPVPKTPQSELIALRQDRSQSELKRLAAAATLCQNCSLWKPATQTVFGHGPEDARVVLLGEQPGDSEDLQGKPFVGPAGKLLDQALQEAGLERNTLYLTNVVKHFKFEPQSGHKVGSGGKIRLHKSPSVAETEACQAWLDAELEHLNPEIIVCLGATAIRSQLGSQIRLKNERGQWFQRDNRIYLATFHPSFVLRQRGQAQKAKAFNLLVSDLAQVAQQLQDRHPRPQAQ